MEGEIWEKNKNWVFSFENKGRVFSTLRMNYFSTTSTICVLSSEIHIELGTRCNKRCSQSPCIARIKGWQHPPHSSKFWLDCDVALHLLDTFRHSKKSQPSERAPLSSWKFQDLRSACFCIQKFRQRKFDCIKLIQKIVFKYKYLVVLF